MIMTRAERHFDTVRKVSNYGVFSCPFFHVFGLTEYGNLRSKSPYSVQIPENRHFLRSVKGLVSQAGGLKYCYISIFNQITL